MLSIIEQVGLKIDQWLAKVHMSIEFFQRRSAQIEADGSPPKHISDFISDSSTDAWKESFSFFERSSLKQSTAIMRRNRTCMSLIKITKIFAKISCEKNWISTMEFNVSELHVAAIYLQFKQ